MNIKHLFQPKPTISDRELKAGLRWWTWEGAASLGFNSITTSGFLAAFALALGANNLQIGILAAIPFILQILQLPSIWIVEKLRWRKAIAVVTWYLAQLIWIPVALIPVLLEIPGGWAISLMLILMTVRGVFNAICNAAWNGWMRDLIPQTMMGHLFSKRLSLAAVFGVVFSLAAAFFIDFWKNESPGNVTIGYTYVLLVGTLLLGLTSPTLMSFIPEPLMQPAVVPQPSMFRRLLAPIKDTNFSRLIRFLLFWAFASNIAIPFFAVYMLTQLGINLSWVILLSILSQVFNVSFLRVWGRFVDRFGIKPVLSLCASLYLLVILGWIFVAMPEKYFLTVPLLVILHIFAGIANAGVTLTVGTIGLKLAPQGEATSYLASASLATNLGAGLGPLVGGILADFFSSRQLNLTLSWVGPASSGQFPAFSLTGFDFLFGIAFIIGLLTLGSLAMLREEGEVGREVILESLMTPMREFSRPLSSVPAYNLLSTFPFGSFRKVPVPGLDVALGVTAYQIAEIARVATLAIVRGRTVTRKLADALENALTGTLKSKEHIKEYGIQIAREAARGAMHVVDDEPLAPPKLAGSIIISVIEASKKAGVKPEDAILGASEGIIQGLVETKADLETATRDTIARAGQIAAQTGLSEELVIARATEGAMTAAKAISPQLAARVSEILSTKSPTGTDSGTK